MLGRSRYMSALGAVLLSVGGVSACGGGSGAVVARVGGTEIAKATVEHWMAVMAGSRVSTQGQALRQRALTFLTSAEWTRGEARELGVNVTDGEAQKQLALITYDKLEGVPYTGLPKQGELPVLFASSTPSDADRLWMMKLAILTTKIQQQRLVRAAQQVTPAQISSYYEAHRSEFVVPERRDIQWIVTYSAASLSKAVHEIQSGKSFVSVATRVSLDPPTITGMELATSREKEFAENVFAAKPHVLSGPFLQSRNHYMLEVTRIAPARQQSLGESEGAIRQRLAAAAVSSQPAAFERKWAARTSCRRGYAVAQCGHTVSTSL